MYRHVRFLGIGASIVATTALVFGCGSSRSVLYSGVSPLGHKRVVTDAAAVRDNAWLVRSGSPRSRAEGGKIPGALRQSVGATAAQAFGAGSSSLRLYGE